MPRRSPGRRGIRAPPQSESGADSAQVIRRAHPGRRPATGGPGDPPVPLVLGAFLNDQAHLADRDPAWWGALPSEAITGAVGCSAAQ